MRFRAITILTSILLFFVVARVGMWVLFDEGDRGLLRILGVAVGIGCVYKGVKYGQQLLALLCAFEAISALGLLNRFEGPFLGTAILAVYMFGSTAAAVVVFKSEKIADLAKSSAYQR
jgi:hypothetical protein